MARSSSLLFAALLCAAAPTTSAAQPNRPELPSRAIPTAAAIDAELQEVMRLTGARGIGLAVIRDGRVIETRTQGARNASGAPLRPDTIMYGASLTKAAFGFTVMQLVEEGKLDLDTSIARYLPQPLPEYPADSKYGPWKDLQGDERWRRLTPRILLNHASGFANFAFVEPDGKLRSTSSPALGMPTPVKGSSCCSSCSRRAWAWTSASRCSAACSTASACATPA